MTQKKEFSSTASLVVLTSLFFMWGFITCMNDILIPYLKIEFALSYSQVMLVQFSFFGAYFVGSVIYFIISSRIGDPINKIGYKNGIIMGLLLAAIGTFLFYPAALIASFPFFLSALFILGLGFTILQIAANPYVAIIGTPETASSRLNLSQGFNSLGTTLAPLIGGFLIFRYFGKTDLAGGSVKIPYLFFSGLFLILALIIKLSRLPVFSNEDRIEHGAGALKFPYLKFGMIAIFLYVGGEVSIGSIMISFLGLKEIAGLNPADASAFVAFYWGGAMIGRFSGSVSLSNISRNKKTILMIIIPLLAFLIVWYLKGTDIALIYSIFLVLNTIAFFAGNYKPAGTLLIFALFSATLLIISLCTKGLFSMWPLIAIGLFNSIMWSNIFTLAIDKLGKYTSQGSSLLVMAILGGALLPLFMGFTADKIGVHYALIVPVISYIYLAFYGWKGYKIGKL